MTQAPLIARTFDTLAMANLEQVYQAGKDEVLRDRGFRILLAHANTVAKLEARRLRVNTDWPAIPPKSGWKSPIASGSSASPKTKFVDTRRPG